MVFSVAYAISLCLIIFPGDRQNKTKDEPAYEGHISATDRKLTKHMKIVGLKKSNEPYVRPLGTQQ